MNVSPLLGVWQCSRASLPGDTPPWAEPCYIEVTEWLTASGLYARPGRACAASARAAGAREARDEHERDQHERRRPGLGVADSRSGDSEYWKIVTGIDATECDGSQSTSCPAIAQVKRSGAVSPAARATASVVPVRIPPSAVGQHDAEHRPPLRDAEGVARLAQAVRDEREHLHRRARDERQHDDREREAAGPERSGGGRCPSTAPSS